MRPRDVGRRIYWTAVIGVLALAAIVLSLVQLERARSSLEIIALEVGTTPATLYRKPGANGPLVVVAHGFAGSTPLMQSYTLTLAQSGYIVLAFDFEGHGRNPVPMSGDVTSIDGTTALLVAETRRVIAEGRKFPGVEDRVALLGHSMATDIIVRAALAEQAEGSPIAAIVAISMFSGAVTASEPDRLLMISGQWEDMLRAIALDNLRQLKPDAREGETVTVNGLTRRAVVAPAVEHVGVLFSATALSEARAWLDAAFDHRSDGPITPRGLWILLLLAGIVALLYPVAQLVPKRQAAAHPIPAARFWIAVILPSLAVPLIGTQVYTPFMPVLVADYLMAHLAAYAGLQLLLVWRHSDRTLSLTPFCCWRSGESSSSAGARPLRREFCSQRREALDHLHTLHRHDPLHGGRQPDDRRRPGDSLAPDCGTTRLPVLARRRGPARSRAAPVPVHDHPDHDPVLPAAWTDGPMDRPAQRAAGGGDRPWSLPRLVARRHLPAVSCRIAP